MQRSVLLMELPLQNVVSEKKEPSLALRSLRSTAGEIDLVSEVWHHPDCKCRCLIVGLNVFFSDFSSSSLTFYP